MGKRKNPETPKTLTKKDKRRVNKRTPGAKLKIRVTKFSNEFKSKAKTRLQLWKEKAWSNSCLDSGVPSTIADIWLAKLVQHYDHSPERSYHNSKLLDFKFNLIDSLGIVPSSCLTFALCFQYFEYNVRQDCLEQNLTALREFCLDGKVVDELLRSAAYILGDLSISSQTDDVERDANLFKDLDLAIFGADHDVYTEYREHLQMEYRHLDGGHFKAIRLKILETFLKIPAIFSTPEFHQRFETTARTNIEREIMELKNN